MTASRISPIVIVLVVAALVVATASFAFASKPVADPVDLTLPPRPQLLLAHQVAVRRQAILSHPYNFPGPGR